MSLSSMLPEISLRKQVVLWAVGILVAALDAFSTIYILERGGWEVNPAMRSMIESFGVVEGVLLVKVIVTIGMVGLWLGTYWLVGGWTEWVVWQLPVIFLVLNTIPAVVNLSQILLGVA